MMALGPSEKSRGPKNNLQSPDFRIECIDYRCCWWQPRLLHSLGKTMIQSQYHRHLFHLHKQIHPFGVHGPQPSPSSLYKLAVLGVGKAVALPRGLLQPCIEENTHVAIQGNIG